MILFLHGLIGTPRHWTRTIRALPSDLSASVFSPDLDYKSHAISDHLERLRLSLPARGPLTIVGNSLGCVLALGLQDRADHLVLTAPPHDFDADPIGLRRDNMAQYIDQLYQDKSSIADFDQHHHEALLILRSLLKDRHGLRQIRRLKKACQALPDDPNLPKAQDRTTFVIGAQDFTTPEPAFRRFMKIRTPKAQLYVAPKCGHAIPLEQPELLARVITRAASLNPAL